MKLGEIVYCNLHLSTIPKNKKKPIQKVILREVIFSYPWDKKIKILEQGHKLLQRNGIKTEMKIDRVEILERLGFKNKGK